MKRRKSSGRCVAGNVCSAGLADARVSNSAALVREAMPRFSFRCWSRIFSGVRAFQQVQYFELKTRREISAETWNLNYCEGRSLWNHEMNMAGMIRPRGEQYRMIQCWGKRI
jgi:hypothetical protein